MEEIKLSKTQDRVFEYITKHGSITTKEAIDELGETRLSARIWELQKKGIPIKTDWKNTTNRFGENRKVKIYSF